MRNNYENLYPDPTLHPYVLIICNRADCQADGQDPQAERRSGESVNCCHLSGVTFLPLHLKREDQV